MKAQRRARSVALQVLYELDCTAHLPGEVITLRLNEEREAGHPLNELAEQLVHKLVSGVLMHRKALDSLIRNYAPEWPLDQMAIVDRNLLRIAIYELIASNETPPKVAINEAVELGKLFGSDSTPRFVNGVLGTLAARQTELASAFRKQSKESEG